MGYSISVKFKSKADQEKMRHFLIDNYDLIQALEISNIRKVSCSNEIKYGSDLSYAPKSSYLLGYHGTGIPEYIWDLCSWMAVKSGVTNKNGNHFIYYDSEKILLTFDSKDTKNTLVDNNGMPIFNKNNYINFELNLGIEKQFNQQIKIFKQINDRWNLGLISENREARALKLKIK